MRILHTADWHFGKTLEGRDRLPEQAEFVDELVRICDEEAVQLVLMAGDVFQTVNPSAEAEELFYEALDRLAAGGRRAVVVIAGNHDNPERIAAPTPLADRLGITLIGRPHDELAPSPRWLAGGEASSRAAPSATVFAETAYGHARRGERIASRRVQRVAAGPSWLELAIPDCPHTAVIAALPYPSEARLREWLTQSLDEADLQKSYSERIARLFSHLASHYRPDTVNLAMSHLFVQGGIESDSEIPIQVGGTYAVAPDAFPKTAQYVALGHLHRPQVMASGPVPVRYAGSPLAYSFSEVGHAKSVTLVDVLPGQPAEVQEIHLSAGRPLVRWQARGGLPEVTRWVEEGRDKQAWIDLEIHLTDALSIQDAQRLRQLHPGFVSIRPVFVQSGEATTREERENLSIDELFVRFYERQRGGKPDEGLVRLFLELTAEGTDAGGDPDAEADDGLASAPYARATDVLPGNEEASAALELDGKGGQGS
ncbi:MAG: exonuclease SbcCD subunit D [Alicyclobacillus herbarius]|uniref:exonuclease SbcCD subunit D n=1 Tax=Alicyclobacillus herbarius TaxID=122960 RepID=UPI0023579384|nr:exonuclease SbcCD subunit D [Alicyclobacillus herbarius]MCL6633070.1 exonuclease SbcCD subunit D [Alicyclobacillus herbarius]